MGQRIDLELCCVETGVCGCFQGFSHRQGELRCSTFQCLYCLAADLAVPKQLKENLSLL